MTNLTTTNLTTTNLTTNRRMIARPAEKPGDWDSLRAAFHWNLPARMNMADLCCTRWARAQPDRLALIHLTQEGRETRWTYGQLEAAAARLAQAFAAHGLRRGDRIAVLLQQSPEVLLTHFAAWKLGAITLPLFTLFGGDALMYRLADSGAKIVVTDAANIEKLDALRADLPGLETVFSIDPTRGALDFHAEIAAATPLSNPAETGPDDPALLIYTSGTTGPPKGVLHGHRVLLGHLPAIELHHEFFPKPGDFGWTPADWAWIGGFMDMAMPCLYYGVAQLSRRMRKFDPEEAFSLIKTHGLHNLFLPPTALKMMRGATPPQGVDIRTISSGGESLGADLLDWGRGALGVNINEIYGQTECNLVVCSSGVVEPARPGAIGKPVPGHDVAIIDSSGTPLARGETGEIAVRAPDPVMFLRYWNKPGATAAKFIGNWLKTGDLGVQDEDGFISFVARDDDVITSAGYRIGPTEIENCLCAHPDILMAAVIGVPDALRTEVVQAYVVLRDGATWEGLEQALIARVRQRVSQHLAPRKIVRVDSLPMTTTGKIMRRTLRDQVVSRSTQP